jgi:hypothetical protein
MASAKVYVTQIPHRKDKVSGEFVPSINLGPASEHGELVIMVPPRTSFFATDELVTGLEEKLRWYNYENGDSLVALGDPAIIAVACAILGRVHGRFLLLKWDRNVGRYLPTHIKLR